MSRAFFFEILTHGARSFAVLALAACPEPGLAGTTDDASTAGDETGASTGAPTTGAGPTDSGDATEPGTTATTGDVSTGAIDPQVDWTVTVGGRAWGLGLAVAVAPAGEIVVAGFEAIDGRDTPFVMALAADGTQLWRTNTPVPLDPGGQYDGVAVDSLGFIYAGGMYTTGDGGLSAGVLHKFSPAGEPVWKFEAADVDASVAAVAVADDMVLTVSTEYQVDDVPAMVVRRHDPQTGAAAWSATPTVAGGGSTGSAVTLSGGRVVAVGAHWPGAGHHPLVAAFEVSGEAALVITDDAVDAGWNGVAALPGGDILVAGTGVEANVAFPMLQRIAPDGATVWTSADQGHSENLAVASDPALGVAVVGVALPDANDKDIFVGLHDASGALFWSETVDGGAPAGFDIGRAAAFGAGSLVAVGGIGGPDGSLDVWVRRYRLE